MRFETINLLFNWFEPGVLLAILFRLSSIFELIAGTQRELRRAIHHLGEHRGAHTVDRRTTIGSMSSADSLPCLQF
jgi:hypothetical protein